MIPYAWQSALRKLFRARPRTDRVSRRRPLLGAELLEDRVVPASRLFAVPAGANTIVELNPATGAQINSFTAPEPAGVGAVGLAFDGTRLFFINDGTDTLYELNPDTGAVLDSDLIAAGSHNYDGLAVVAGKVYIQDFTADQLIEFDPDADVVTLILGAAPGVDLFGGLAGASNPGALIGPINGGNLIGEIDPATGAVTNSFQPGFPNLLGAAVVGDEIYLGSGSTNVLYRYTRDGTFLGQLTLASPVVALASDDPTGKPAPGAQFVNGDFEVGTITGWTAFNQQTGQSVGFRTYAGPNPLGSGLPAPPQGSIAAFNDHQNAGTYILYQDVTLPTGQFHTLSLQLSYNNLAGGGFVTPDTLDYQGGPNQQFRVDVISPTGDLLSTGAGTVLLNVFRTDPGEPQEQAPTTVTADLTAFAGQTVRLRIAVANNMAPLYAGVDDVKVASSEDAPTGTVSGVKFNDLDGDSTRDAGEPGLPGWTIYADLNNNEQLNAGEPSAVTGADGAYSFTLSPGTYTLREVPQAGWVQTSPLSERLFVVRGGGGNGVPQTISELDASGAVLNSFAGPVPVVFPGPQGLATSGGSLFYIDGSQPAGGTGPHTLYELNSSTGAVLDADVLPATADIAGLAYLDGLVYVQVYPTDQVLVFDPTTDTVVRTLTVPADIIGGLTGASDLGLLFATNGNGQVIAIDPQTGAVVRTLNTGAGALIGGLAYYRGELIGIGFAENPAFRIDPQTGAVLGTLPLGGTGGPATGLAGDGPLTGAHRVTVAADQVTGGLDFGNVQDQGTVSGVKFNDLDGDGVRDAGEPGLQGWTIYADLDNDRQLDSGEPFAVTGADGSYVLALPSGTVTLREVAQDGWVQTSPLSYSLYSSGDGGNTLIAIDPATGTAVRVGAFGQFLSSQTQAGAFTPDGTYWTIVNGFDAAQARLAKVNLTTGTATPVGGVLWTGSPFFALEADAAGTLFGVNNSGQLYRINTTNGVATLVANTNSPELTDVAFDAAGVLWGVRSGNVLVRIDPVTGAGQVLGPITGLDGTVRGLMIHPGTGTFYLTTVGSSALFALNPTTRAATKVGTGLGVPNPTGGDFRVIDDHTLTVAAGAVLTGRDFGNRRNEGTVSGTKFNDLDGDGVRDAGEPALSGWTIYADLNNDRQRDASEPSAVTGADGSYSLTVPSGAVTIREVAQAGWVQTSPFSYTLYSTGFDGTQLVTIDPATGTAAVVGPFGTTQTWAVAFTPDGTLWTIVNGFDAAQARLAKVNPATGAVTPVGNPNWTGSPMIALEADTAGNLYGGNFNGQFFRIDKSTGATTLVGQLGFPGVMDFAFDPAGTLWAVGEVNRLFRVNPATGASTFVAQIAGADGEVMGLMIHPGTGTFYATTYTSSAALYTLNPATGAATRVGSTLGIPVPHGGDFDVVSGHAVTVTAGAVLTGRDFGNRRDEGTVSGVKFNDLDGDGTCDAGEPGLPNWTIYADLNNNEQRDGNEPSAVTGADGSYTLTLPSGSYVIREVAQTGWVQTSPTVVRLFTVRATSGGPATITELDPSGVAVNSFVAPGTVVTTGPQGLADGGRSLFYIDGSAGTSTSRTLYELDPFTGAVRDSDSISIGAAVGLAYLNGLVYIVSGPSQITVFDPVTDTVVRTLPVPAALAGGLTGAADLGLLFATNNSAQVIAVDPLTGIVVRTLSPGVGILAGGLSYRSGELIAAPFVTSPTQLYRINPQTGAVLGVLTSVANLIGGLGGDGVVTRAHRVTVSAGATLTGRDFGNVQDQGTVSGVKFNDLDGDGVRDAGEPGLQGWTIYADLDNDRQLDSGEPFAVTGADGSYVLALPSGTVTIREVAQTGWRQTSPTADSFYALRIGLSAPVPLISRLSPTGAVLNTFAGPGFVGTAGPQGLADAGGSLFYIDGSVPVGTGGTPHTLYELDSATGAVLDSDVLSATTQISGLAYLGGLVYVLVDQTDQVLVFDPTTDTVVRTFTVPADIIGGLTGAADRGLLYGTNINGAIYAIDPATGAVVRTLLPNVGPLTGGLAYFRGELIATNFGGSSPAFRINPDTGAVIGTITLGGTGPISGLGGDGAASPIRALVAAGQVLADQNFGNRQNTAPTAVDDTAAVGEDAVLTVVAPGVLANDTDADLNDSKVVTAVNGSAAVVGQEITLPSGARLTLRADGSYTYRTNGAFNALRADQTATDTFTYTMRDGMGVSSSATVTITITGANDPPVARPDSAGTTEDAAVSVNVLANDPDPDQGDTRTVVAVNGGPVAVDQTVTLPSGARVTLNADGTFTYDPRGAFDGLRAGQSASDSFTYTMRDGPGATSTAIVTVTIAGVNDAPVASDQSKTTPEDTAVTGQLVATDAEGDALGFAVVAGPAFGTLDLDTTTGAFTYTPAANYFGPDGFTVKANDGAADSNVAAVSLTVTAVNDAPSANADSATTDEDVPVTVAVLGNDEDADGDPLSVTEVTPPAHGTATLNGDGTVTYVPNANYNGTDLFRYTISDGQGGTSTADVTLTIRALNDAPVAVGDSAMTDEDTPVTIAVLTNDTDVDGDTLVPVVDDQPDHGSVVVNPDGTIAYTPAADYNGPDSFTYTVNDGQTDSAAVTVSLTVIAVNDAPVANAGNDITIDEGGTASLDGRGSSDPEGDALGYTWKLGDTVLGTGPVLDVPFPDSGTYAVTLTVTDGQLSSSDEVLVTVRNVDPTATASGPGVAVPGQPVTFTFTAADVSPADRAAGFTYAINWGDGTTETVFGGGASLTRTHAYSRTGAFTVGVTVTDKDGGTGTAGRTIGVTAVNLQGGHLFVGGTTGSDAITVRPADAAGGLSVTVNGANFGPFAPSGDLVVFGLAGNDTITLSTTKIKKTTVSVTRPAYLFGGDGADTIDARGTTAGVVAVGGAGNDTITGGTGADVLIGGADADQIRGGDGSDILIGGSTVFDDDLTALRGLRAEWTRTDLSYDQRVARLRTGAGGYALTSATVSAAQPGDRLWGEGNTDWFFAPPAQAQDDKKDEEFN